MVVVSHMYYRLTGCGMPGLCGAVSFFFVISGFVMCMGYARRYEQGTAPSYRQFVFNRLKRVFPGHWVCCILWLLVAPGINLGSVLDLRHCAFLVQSWIPLGEVYFGGNPVAWFLSDMLLCYALFPLLIGGILAPLRKLIVAVATVAVAYAALVLSVAEQDVHYILYINPVTRLADFGLGMILWRIYRSLGNRSVGGTTVSAVIEIASVVLFVGACFAEHLFSERYTYACYWWLPVSLLILAFSYPSDSVVQRLMQHPWLQTLGKLSFSIYLIHFIMLYACERFTGSLPTWTAFALTLASVLIAAWALECILKIKIPVAGVRRGL